MLYSIPRANPLWVFGPSGKRARIHASRINSARLLCETIAKLDSKPKTVISTSGCGIYALHNGNTPLDESGALGRGISLFKVAQGLGG